MIETSRRSLITGLVALVAAPAIVKVASLMPIKPSLQPDLWTYDDYINRIVQPMADRLERKIADAVINGRSDVWLTFDDPNGVSMREITDYKPGDEARLDVLYGSSDKSLSSEDVRLLMERQVDDRDMSGTAINARYQAQLAADRAFYDGPQWSRAEMDQMIARQRAINDARGMVGSLEQATTPLALAAAAVAVAPEVLAKRVTRRFWGK